MRHIEEQGTARGALNADPSKANAEADRWVRDQLYTVLFEDSGWTSQELIAFIIERGKRDGGESED